MPVPRLSFIVPVRNDAVRLRTCLESIRASSARFACEILVVDNGSTDNSADVAKQAGARVITMPGVRVSELRNAAAREAAGGVLAFVDADHELAREWTETALSVLDDSTVSAVGAQCRAPADGTWVQQMYDRLRRHEPGLRDVAWLPSGNTVIRKAAFQQVGGFDTTLETCEDVDLSQRLVAAGHRLVATDGLRSVHFGDPATLKALFLGELWRGRDNLRVTLRGPLTIRSLPSIAIPVLGLIGTAAIVLGAVLWPLLGIVPAFCGTVILAALTAVRASALLWQAEPLPINSAVLGRAVVVAAAYNEARALALVARIGHDSRKRA